MTKSNTSIKVTSKLSMCLVLLVILISMSQIVQSTNENKCRRFLRDIETIWRDNKPIVNQKKQPILMQIVSGDTTNRSEIAKKCERICKDCPHEGGKMCNCDNYTLEKEDQWPINDNTDPNYDDFGDLDENVEEKPNFNHGK